MQYPELIALAVTVAVTISIFLLCREIVCWYFKINERAELQRTNNKLLKEILVSLSQPKTETSEHKEDVSNIDN
jgi:hypothetical protein